MDVGCAGIIRLATGGAGVRPRTTDGAEPDFRIETVVLGPRLQIAAHEADGPITVDSGKHTDVVSDACLTQLLVARVLDHRRVRSQDVVEPAKPGTAVRQSRAVVVPERMRILYTLAGLLIITGQEV